MFNGGTMLVVGSDAADAQRIRRMIIADESESLRNVWPQSVAYEIFESTEDGQRDSPGFFDAIIISHKACAESRAWAHALLRPVGWIWSEPIPSRCPRRLRPS